MTTLREIIETHLRATECDGLLNDDCDCACACVLGDLFPCGGPDYDNCIAGVNDPHEAWKHNLDYLLYPKQ